MEFLELARSRHSVRSYQPKKVEEEKLRKILEAGRIAPTGANRQPHRLLVVREPQGLEKLKKAANIYGAPLAVIVCGDHSEAWKRPFDGRDITDIDVSIVTAHMMMEATDLGLGTIWVCYFKPDIVKKEFNIPGSLEVISILGIGYEEGKAPSMDRYDRERLPVSDIVSYESMR